MKTPERIYRLCKRFGIWEGLRLASLIILKRTESLRIPNLPAPVSLRRGTTDVEVFSNVFLTELYSFPVRAPVHTVVDAGANIGLTSIYLAERFSQARVISIEPEHSNFRQLRKNVEAYDRIECIEAGLWSRPTTLAIKNASAKKWGFEVVETEGSGIQAVSVEQVMSEWHLEILDILKIDIEGAELEVFDQGAESWLPRVRYLVIETHDRKRDGTSKAVFSAVNRFNFNCRLRGDNLIFENLDLRDHLVDGRGAG